MKSWTQAARDALVSGSVASATSTAALAACGAAEAGSPYAASNAVSHWYFGDRAARQDGPSWRYTATGALTHHAASVFWAIFYEKLGGGPRRAHNSAVQNIGEAAMVAALACFVDYRLTPRRLMPGYEQRISRPALAVVYASFAAGLALGGALLSITSRGRR
jgi:hypothetical protein